MTDYHPLIARAVDGLERSTGEARRALYERARTALVTQLRSVDPPLSESEITKERLALEDAIRKVEAEAARKARAEQRTPAAPLPPRRERPIADGGRSEPRRTELPPARSVTAGPSEPAMPRAAAGQPNEPAIPRAAAIQPGEPAVPRAATAQPSARERLLNARTQSPPSLKREGIRGFRDVVSEVHDLGGPSAKTAPSGRDSYPPPFHAADRAEDEDTAHEALNDYGTEGDADDLSAEPYGGGWSSHNRQTSHVHDDDEDMVSARSAEDEEHLPPRPARDYRGLIKIALVALAIIAALVILYLQWPRITGVFHSMSQIGARQPALPSSPQANSQPKFSGRVPQEGAGQAPAGQAPGQAVPAVAQRVVLYEEDSNDPQGKRYVGSVIWRTETVSPGPGLAPELAVRADVEIPERHITMTWSLRRNTDPALPASHTIEIMFNLPADFPGGGIANVPGILMKQSEQARGTPLAGLAVKVTNGFFLIGLSAVENDQQRNMQLLKERPWFDIPIVYTNGGRAILALEKGTPGDRAFADAFAAWEKK
jgi:hypothetical protein